LTFDNFVLKSLIVSLLYLPVLFFNYAMVQIPLEFVLSDFDSLDIVDQWFLA